MEINDKSRNIPSLDGLRAISIGLVILAHTNSAFAGWVRLPVALYLILARTGVNVFFVISGFLITNLLLKELHATKTISLKRFYLRRAFRIFPPFYFYLGILYILVVTGVFHASLRAFLFCAIYLGNYYFGPGGGFVGLQHIWSLSVEEQFYLLWPATLLRLGKRRAVAFATVLILISPFLCLVTYALLAPEYRAAVNRMFHTSVDTIMFGCLLALLCREEDFRTRMLRWIHSSGASWTFAGCVLFLAIIDPLLAIRLRGAYGLLLGGTLEGIAISVLVLYVVERPRTLAGRLLNTKVLRHIGVISYSLYLWQSIILDAFVRYFPLNVLAVWGCAEFSYWIVERPSMRVRDRLRRIRAERQVQPQV
jgi:peptidoglycan/LPS O-acetylase OafA/YrhL